METKVRAASGATLVVGAFVSALAEQDISVEQLVTWVVTAAVTAFVGWFTRNGNLAPSTLEAAGKPPA